MTEANNIIQIYIIATKINLHQYSQFYTNTPTHPPTHVYTRTHTHTHIRIPNMYITTTISAGTCNYCCSACCHTNNMQLVQRHDKVNGCVLVQDTYNYYNIIMQHPI